MFQHLSIVTITYRDDLKKFDRLARTLKKYCDLNSYHWYVINNDDISYHATIIEILAKYTENYTLLHWKDFQQLVDTINEELHYDPAQTETYNGWHTQQCLKLLISNYIRTPYYITFDSDDYFTSHYNLNNFIANQKIFSLREKLEQDDFEYFRINAFDLFDLDYTKIDLVLSVAPPVILQTIEVKKLLDYLNQKNIKLLDILGNAIPIWERTVEYYLYYAWLCKNNLTNNLHWVKTMHPIPMKRN